MGCWVAAATVWFEVWGSGGSCYGSEDVGCTDWNVLNMSVMEDMFFLQSNQLRFTHFCSTEEKYEQKK